MNAIYNEWTFIVRLENQHLCIIDLSSEDDRGDVEPYRGDRDLSVGCMFGCEDSPYHRIKRIEGVWRYSKHRFNDKFHDFTKVSIEDFVRRVFDAMKFDGYSEEEIAKTKKDYGLWF